jgi:hypothetical protein
LKPLEVEFVRNGYLYKQIKRSDRVAIYTQQSINDVTNAVNKKKNYEVILIRKHKSAKYPDGSESPAREIYPHELKWGVQGFTFMVITDAAFKFLELKERFG